MPNCLAFTIRDLLWKKWEPEEKTASKSVDAPRRHSLACVKKINSSKNSSRWLSCLGGAKLCLLQILMRRKWYLPAPFFWIITIKVYVSAYHSNPIFMENSNMIMNNIFSKSCGNYPHRHENRDHKHENRHHKHENRDHELDNRDQILNNFESVVLIYTTIGSINATTDLINATTDTIIATTVS